jgi:hypothetical protein
MFWKTPFDPGRIFSSPGKAPENTQPAKDLTPKDKPRTPHAMVGKRRARISSSRAASVDDAKSDVRDARATAASEDEQDDSYASVKSNSAAVYSLNSSSSKILKRLKKGDKIETSLEVIDTEGRWSLIKGIEEKSSGYVRSENLEMRQPAKPKN